MKSKILLTALIATLTIVACEKKEVITRKEILVEQAKKNTLENLKSPSSAVFVDSTATLVKLDGEDEKYRVNLTVDAQNGFGAMIRKRFNVVYKFKGGDSLDIKNYDLEMFF